MDKSELIKLAEKLTNEERWMLIEELLDVLLSSDNLEKIQDDVGWRINEAYRRSGLNDVEFIGELGYAVSIIHPQKFLKIVERFSKSLEGR